MGVNEAAELLEWDKRKVATYHDRASKYRAELINGERQSLPPDIFPEPVQRLASGSLWTRKQILDYKTSRK